MKKVLIPMILATAGLAASAAPVDAHGSHRRVEVTTGRFQTLPGGEALGYDVSGGAIMFRSDHGGGSTAVVVRIGGLEPDTTYKAHVHNLPCSATPAGGRHYQNVTGGAVDAVNEIWPGFTTDSRGRGFGWATHDARARDDARSIVVHDPEDSSVRLACVDLT